MRLLLWLALLGGCYGFVTENDVRDAEDRDGDGVTYEDDCDDRSSGSGAVQTWYPDDDGDGFGDMDATGTESCDDLGARGMSLDHTDCNDADAAITPDAEEACDDIDNDCNGAVDEASECEDHNTDGDGDGFAADVDCDDTDADVYPNAEETWYDGVDQDCDGGSDYDQDADGHDSDAHGGDDCDDQEATTYAGALEVCDNLDNDCDGEDDNAVDDDGDYYHECGGDCDDADPDVNEDAYDTCDAIDNDCDGVIDENDDEDGDGWSTCMGDCHDAEPLMNPGELEVCGDNIDNDCDWSEDYADEDGDGVNDFDEDGDGNLNCGDYADCDDHDPDVYWGAEELTDDVIDSDCDGNTDT